MQSPLFPLYDKINPTNLAAGLTSLLKEVNQSMDQLEATQATSWQDTVNPYEIVSDRLNVAWGIVDHLQASISPCILVIMLPAASASIPSNCTCDSSGFDISCLLSTEANPACVQSVKNNDALRAMVNQLQPDYVTVSQRLSQSSPLYKKFQFIRNSTTKWTEAQTRVLDNLIVSAKLSGAALDVSPSRSLVLCLLIACLHQILFLHEPITTIAMLRARWQCLRA